jgi:single-strand DNA-binding protein
MYINKALIFGNLTKDPELKALPSGAQVVNFSLATNRVWKDQNGARQENTDFHNVVLFGKQAELAAQYLKKGSSVYIEGRMQTRSWDGQDGKKQYRTEVVGDIMQFGPKGSEASGGGSKSPYSAPSSPSSSYSAPKAAKATPDPIDSMPSVDYPEEEINPEDIPF